MVKLNEKQHISELKSPGDYCFGSDGKVILACPGCGKRSYCPHTVLQKFPLTLSPSVVEHPCEHHFFVDNGYAKMV